MTGGLDPVGTAGGRASRFWPMFVALGLSSGAGITEAPAQEIVRRVGRVTFRVDASSGVLTMNVIVTSPQLPAPVQYSLQFTGAPARPSSRAWRASSRT